MKKPLQLRARRAILRVPLYVLANESRMPEPRLKLVERGFIEPTDDEWTMLDHALARMEAASGYRWEDVAR